MSEPAQELVDEHGAAVDPSTVDVEDFAPHGADLVVARPDDTHDALIVMDRHVELEIVAEFQRRALEVMLYDVPIGGKRQIDLSYAGVSEAVRLLNGMGGQEIGIVQGTLDVHTEEYDVGDGPEPFFVATVMAVNKVTGYGQYGTSSEPQWVKLTSSKAAAYRKDKKRVREDDKVFDVHARAKAINKAQRNALKVQIPEQMRQTMIATYKNDERALKVIQAGVGAVELAELPPPLVDDEALKLKDQARALYAQIREESTLALLPAAFHAYLTRAEHSHDRLGEFIAYLEGKLEEVKASAGGAS